MNGAILKAGSYTDGDIVVINQPINGDGVVVDEMQGDAQVSVTMVGADCPQPTASPSATPSATPSSTPKASPTPPATDAVADLGNMSGGSANLIAMLLLIGTLISGTSYLYMRRRNQLG